MGWVGLEEVHSRPGVSASASVSPAAPWTLGRRPVLPVEWRVPGGALGWVMVLPPLELSRPLIFLGPSWCSQAGLPWVPPHPCPVPQDFPHPTCRSVQSPQDMASRALKPRLPEYRWGWAGPSLQLIQRTVGAVLRVVTVPRLASACKVLVTCFSEKAVGVGTDHPPELRRKPTPQPGSSLP